MTKTTLVVLLAVALVAAACGPAATGQNSSKAGAGPAPQSAGGSNAGAPAAAAAGQPQSPNSAATVPPSPAGQGAVTAATPAGQAVYAPPKLQDAPANIRDFVILGGSILTDTQKVLAGTVGNKLNCSNCHFEGGITQGGKNGGISLVGVGAKYPAFTSRHNGPTDLSLRTFDWLQRSENGKVLPLESKEFQGILAYYQWISKGIPVYGDVPWLGVKPIPNYQAGDKARGQQVYQTACSACHGADGNGTPAAPPVWGDGSYNDGAGMSRPETLAAFALLNMPRNNPTLTQQQAEDVGAFVNSQPRTHYTGK